LNISSPLRGTMAVPGHFAMAVPGHFAMAVPGTLCNRPKAV